MKLTLLSATALLTAHAAAQAPQWGVVFFSTSDCSDNDSYDVQLVASSPRANQCYPAVGKGVDLGTAKAAKLYCEATACDGYVYMTTTTGCQDPVGPNALIDPSSGCTEFPEGTAKGLLASSSDAVFG